LIGHYSSSSFKIGHDNAGHVVITDPAVVNNERAATDISAGPQNNSNLPDIGFGARTTLGGSANSGNPGGLWSFLEGIDGKLALLTNYIAGSFGTGAV